MPIITYQINVFKQKLKKLKISTKLIKKGEKLQSVIFKRLKPIPVCVTAKSVALSVEIIEMKPLSLVQAVNGPSVLLAEIE